MQTFTELNLRGTAEIALAQALEKDFTAYGVRWYQVAAHDSCSDGRSQPSHVHTPKPEIIRCVDSVPRFSFPDF